MTLNCSSSSCIQTYATPDAVKGGLISREAMRYIQIALQVVLITFTSLLGIASNIVNIIVYWKQGIKESTTVGLFALSISDFFVVFLPLFMAAATMIDHVYPELPVAFGPVTAATFVFTRNMFFNISSTLTAFLSVERCLCVIRPLKVKVIFTRNRTIFVIIAIFSFYVIGWIPKFFAQQVRWQKPRGENSSSILTIWFHPSFDHIETYHNSLMTIFIPTATQVVVTFTAVLMVNGLRKASNFRQTARNKTSINRQKKDLDGINSLDLGIPDKTLNPEKSDKGKQPVLDSRDARLVKTMLVLVVLMSLANIPYIAVEYTQLFVEELRAGRQYWNLFRILFTSIILLGSVNASANAVVYYKIGSRYRHIVDDMFRCRPTGNGPDE